jgi:hypothetical protein
MALEEVVLDGDVLGMGGNFYGTTNGSIVV